MKLDLLYTMGDVAEARRYAAEEEAAAEVFTGSIWPAMFLFRHILAITAWLPEATGGERTEAQATLERLMARLARWTKSAPDNFEHLHLLTAAEVARVSDRPGEAMERYEAAIEEIGRAHV